VANQVLCHFAPHEYWSASATDVSGTWRTLNSVTTPPVFPAPPPPIVLPYLGTVRIIGKNIARRRSILKHDSNTPSAVALHPPPATSPPPRYRWCLRYECGADGDSNLNSSGGFGTIEPLNCDLILDWIRFWRGMLTFCLWILRLGQRYALRLTFVDLVLVLGFVG
jgi:hypothetical protein